VDRVVDGWADLELEIPGPNREEFLQNAAHTKIFWPKAHIRIMQRAPSPPADSPTSPAEGPIRRPERGSEWEPIKILLLRENSAYTPNSQLRIPTRVCQGHIVTTVLPTVGTNPK
jgi:hypothetical protein